MPLLAATLDSHIFDSHRSVSTTMSSSLFQGSCYLKEFLPRQCFFLQICQFAPQLLAEGAKEMHSLHFLGKIGQFGLNRFESMVKCMGIFVTSLGTRFPILIHGNATVVRIILTVFNQPNATYGAQHPLIPALLVTFKLRLSPQPTSNHLLNRSNAKPTPLHTHTALYNLPIHEISRNWLLQPKIHPSPLLGR